MDTATALEMTDDRLQSMFGKHGLRCTRQRLMVYQALSATSEHPTADHIFQSVADADASISLATVYNTLEAFCRVGLAQKLPGPGGSARYDACVHNHLHLRDHESGEVTDVPDNLGEQLLRSIPRELLNRLEKELGFTVEQVQIELVGKYR